MANKYETPLSCLIKNFKDRDYFSDDSIMRKNALSEIDIVARATITKNMILSAMDDAVRTKDRLMKDLVFLHVFDEFATRG